VDGHPTGLTTPAEVPVDRQPAQRIRLTKKGFEQLEAEITSEQAANGSIAFKLSAEAPNVRLIATGTYPFSMFDGKRQLAPAAQSHELSAVQGGHTLRLVAPDHFVDYSVKIGTTGKSMVISAPELGDLSIRSGSEICRLLVNGRDLGFPPLNLSVAPGTYRIQLKCPDASEMPTKVETVVAGEAVIAKIP
jgi:hypothetical protein